MALPEVKRALKQMPVEMVGLDKFQILLKKNLSDKLEVVLRQLQINSDEGQQEK